jgi:hypothetical protein
MSKSSLSPSSFSQLYRRAVESREVNFPSGMLAILCSLFSEEQVITILKEHETSTSFASTFYPRPDLALRTTSGYVPHPATHLLTETHAPTAGTNSLAGVGFHELHDQDFHGHAPPWALRLLIRVRGLEDPATSHKRAR